MEKNPYKAPAEQVGDIKRRPYRRWLATGQRTAVFSVAIANAFICAVLAFGDIGFDHPGRYGLDFDHLVLLVFCQSVLTLSWIWLAIKFEKLSLIWAIPAVVLATLVALHYGD